jgi:putative phosphoribosyl transferase
MGPGVWTLILRHDLIFSFADQIGRVWRPQGDREKSALLLAVRRHFPRIPPLSFVATDLLNPPTDLIDRSIDVTTAPTSTSPVQLQVGHAVLDGDLVVPREPAGLVVFAHGSGSSRFSTRNRSVAQVLVNGGFATLLLDLLTQEEEAIDIRTLQYRFDIDRLGKRVVGAVDWAAGNRDLAGLGLACFGASTGAAAALIAAAERPALVKAVISRGGRPDLAGDALPKVSAPTLLIVGGADEPVIELNRLAMRQMRAPVDLRIVPGATHLFEEPGALDVVSQLALEWCRRHLGKAAR